MLQDVLFNGSRFRILSIVYNYSKKCLALDFGRLIKGADAVDELERLHVVERVVPKHFQFENGSEFISNEVDRWAYEHSSLSFPLNDSTYGYTWVFQGVRSEV